MKFSKRLASIVPIALKQVADHFTIPENFTSWPDFLKFATLYSLIGAVTLSGFGPEGTQGLGFVAAIVHWFLHLFVSMMIMISVNSIGIIAGLQAPWTLILSVISLPFILALPSLMIDTVIGVEEQEAEHTVLVYAYLQEVLDILHPAINLAAITVLFAARTVTLTKKLRESLVHKVSTEPVLQTVLPQVPHHLEQDLIRIQAQDHYILVVTKAGQAIVHMPFSQAVKVLTGFRGIQCHRSHWVRYRHVLQIDVDGSAYRAKLDNGDIIPVSRRRYARVRAETALKGQFRTNNRGA